jgi:hypothetical protein
MKQNWIPSSLATVNRDVQTGPHYFCDAELVAGVPMNILAGDMRTRDVDFIRSILNYLAKTSFGSIPT